MSALATDVAVEREFRRLLREWLAASADERAKVDQELEVFVREHIAGEVERYALVLRAWNALEQGDDEVAAATAREVRAGAPGVVQDLGTLVLGAAERRLGHHLVALEILTPLLHKMLDDFATALLDEELCEAAIGAGKPRPAVHFMESWLRETEPGARPRVAARIRELLGRLPLDVLRSAALDGSVLAAPRTDDQPGFAELLVGELARIATRLREVELARLLLDRFGGLLGASGEAVARLAAETIRARVAKDTVGLLLSLRNEEMARRSAEVSAGVAFGLGLPRVEAHLVSRATRGTEPAEVYTALAALAAGGASILVAGIDPEEVVAVAEFARREELPVLFLQPPPTDVDSDYAFAVGDDPAANDALLLSALAARGAGRVVRFGRAEEGLSRPPVAPGGGFDVVDRACDRTATATALRALGAGAVLVVDGAACGAEVADAAHAAGAVLAVGLGVPRMGALGSLGLAAGLYPVGVAGTPELEGWLAARSLPPSWWSALGRDAAALAWRAVRQLDAAATDDPTKVTAVRRRARDTLGGVFEALWTSEAHGFDARRRIPRTLRVVGSEGRRSP
ncbi:MAG: hypothetical protein HY908_24820 [Myxococcales bacterium]|nr:hypothetical protein [Myxococcales bacterium]